MMACTFRRALLAVGLTCILACAALVTYLDESSYLAMSLRKFRTKREAAWSTHDLTKFSRAAVLFLPASSGNDRFLSEFRWFHRSWLEMQKHEPALWRTDIVVVSDGPVPLLAELGCTDSPRAAHDEPNKCVAVQNYTKLQNENFTYAYADSVNVLAVDLPATANYDWILRTDIDTFLTPAFATWKPDSFAVGLGGYCGPGTCDRLARISRDLNLTEATQHNIGSTWYGPATTLKECAKLSVETMMYLREHEFTDEEKSEAYGTKGWPKWHYGVLTMYSGDIAINHCTRSTGFETRTDMLDFPSSSSESPHEHAHLHTWQNDVRFSKFVFHFKGYPDEKLEDLDLNVISDYAMYMALDSHKENKGA